MAFYAPSLKDQGPYSIWIVCLSVYCLSFCP